MMNFGKQKLPDKLDIKTSEISKIIAKMMCYELFQVWRLLMISKDHLCEKKDFCRNYSEIYRVKLSRLFKRLQINRISFLMLSSGLSRNLFYSRIIEGGIHIYARKMRVRLLRLRRDFVNFWLRKSTPSAPKEFQLFLSEILSEIYQFY